MRAAPAFWILLFLGAGAAAALQFGIGGAEPAPLVAKTKSAFGEVAEEKLEKTAD